MNRSVTMCYKIEHSIIRMETADMNVALQPCVNGRRIFAVTIGAHVFPLSSARCWLDMVDALLTQTMV